MIYVRQRRLTMLVTESIKRLKKLSMWKSLTIGITHLGGKLSELFGTKTLWRGVFLQNTNVCNIFYNSGCPPVSNEKERTDKISSILDGFENA